MLCHVRQDAAERGYLPFKLSRLGFIADPIVNCQIDVSQEGIASNVKAGVPYANMSRWALSSHGF